MDSIKTINYLEEIRYKRNMTQVEFLDNIVSLRQYKRYRKGECEISIDILSKLTKKLNISLSKLLINYDLDKKQTIYLINELYKLVIKQDLEEAKEKIDELNQITITDVEHLQYFNHTVDLYQFYTNQINPFELIDRTKKLISYPHVLERKVLSDIEILIISSFLEMDKFECKELILHKVLDLLVDDESMILCHRFNIKMIILIRMAKYFEQNNLYEKVIDICNLGIKISKEDYSYYMLDYCYYYKAIAYKALHQETKVKYNYNQCWNVLKLENNQTKIDKFEEIYSVVD